MQTLSSPSEPQYVFPMVIDIVLLLVQCKNLFRFSYLKMVQVKGDFLVKSVSSYLAIVKNVLIVVVWMGYVALSVQFLTYC